MLSELERNIKDMKASIDETVADIDREKLELLKKSAKAQGLNVDDLLARFRSGGSPVASAQADTQEDNSDQSDDEAESDSASDYE